jgi:hypothetical protein
MQGHKFCNKHWFHPICSKTQNGCEYKMLLHRSFPLVYWITSKLLFPQLGHYLDIHTTEQLLGFILKNFLQLTGMKSSQQFLLWASRCGCKSWFLSLFSRRNYHQITNRLWTTLTCFCRMSTSFVYLRDSTSYLLVHGQYWGPPCRKWLHKTFSALLEFHSIEFYCVCSTKVQSLCP